MSNIHDSTHCRIREYILKEWEKASGLPEAFAKSLGFKPLGFNRFSKYSEKLGREVIIHYSPVCNGWGCKLSD